MTRFRENKMAAKNFKKLFLIEDVELSSRNLVGLCPSRASMLSRKSESLRLKRYLWRIFESSAKKVVFANWGERLRANRKWYRRAVFFVRRRRPPWVDCWGSQCSSYYYFRSKKSQSQKSKNRILSKLIILLGMLRLNRKRYEHDL